MYGILRFCLFYIKWRR